MDSSISFLMNMETVASFGPTPKSHLSLRSRSNLISVCKLSRFPLISFSGKPGKPVRLKASPSHIGDVKENTRTFKEIPPSPWPHHFLSVHVDASEMDMLGKEIEALKPIVGGMLMSSQCVDSIKNRIILIYLLVCLGLMYLFEDEIEESLKVDFENIEDILAGEHDLCTVSTIFWVFRKYGYNMSSDVFKRFKGENGKFKECLSGDAKGMVSLYEAAHLGTPTDYILDEALRFTTSNLKTLATAGASPSHISVRIRNALRMPQHYNVEMVFTREYISFYEQEEDHNEMLLRFSKINFKFLQLNWIQELKTLSKWWKQQELVSKLPPFFRDRTVECYLYAVLVYFEPRFSRGRAAFGYFGDLLTVIDDTCDRYGSVSEITDLVHCVERWDLDCLESLPDFMKTVFKFTWNVFEKCQSDGRSEEGLSYNVQSFLEEFKKFMRANLSYAKWAQSDVVPTFDEFLAVGGAEVTMYVSIACVFLGLRKNAREEAYEWLKSRPKLVVAQAARGRLMNDMTGFKDDMSRGYKANAINYYMSLYGVTEEEAFVELKKMVRDLDKQINEEILLETKTVPRETLKRATGFGKMVVYSYRNGDENFTFPEGTFKDHITSLFVDLIRL
ncbi:unnamed protein product [Thlaspi arvense]|uniref:Uncharacterized protein n=1 Tax=Thlaspi arvense TaxID=13288 RepID=A0AAU9T9L1_THLAR|nr:unnamed protein product [Thlaspi arvense]